MMEVLLGTQNYMIILSESIKEENVKQQVRNKQTWWLYIKSSFRGQLQYLTYNVKKAYIFHLVLFGISSTLLQAVKGHKILQFKLNRVARFFLSVYKQLSVKQFTIWL